MPRGGVSNQYSPVAAEQELDEEIWEVVVLLYLFDHDRVFSVAGQRDEKAGNDQNTMAKIPYHP
ncbi:MAG: hypothetical protein IPM89_11005 [Candidatus Competibacteraceae bacterium]|nr:MAG: hypothetical protein IPM89_11005 [Candidatus Competibacteraceae bacterium]